MKFDRKINNLVANLRSLPENQSQSSQHDVLQLDSLLDGIVDQYRICKSSYESIIMNNWEYIAGVDNSHRCAPLRIVGGSKLIVMVSNSTLKQEMEFEKRRMLNRIRTIPECRTVKQIVFQIGS